MLWWAKIDFKHTFKFWYKLLRITLWSKASRENSMKIYDELLLGLLLGQIQPSVYSVINSQSLAGDICGYKSVNMLDKTYAEAILVVQYRPFLSTSISSNISSIRIKRLEYIQAYETAIFAPYALQLLAKITIINSSYYLRM